MSSYFLVSITSPTSQLKSLFHPDTRRRGKSHLVWLEGQDELYPRFLQAYEVLKTPALRTQYDLQLQSKYINSITDR